MSFTERLEKLGFGKKQQIALLTQLYHLAHAGVPAPDALRHMQQAYKAKRNSGMAMVCDLMVENAGNGRKIAEGMEDWFSYEVCTILNNSERRGILTEGLKNVVEYLGVGSAFMKPFQGCITGVFYILSLLVAIAILGVKYIPQIGQYVTDWPDISKALYSTSKVLYYGYPYIIVGVIALIVWVVFSIKNYRPGLTCLIAMPFMRLYRAMHCYNLLKILSLLSKNGVGVPEIITTVRAQYQTGYLSRCYALMADRISDGEQNMGVVMDTGLFNNQQISELQLISSYVGEENYARIFTAMADILFENTLKLTTMVASIFNASSLVLMALGILWVYGSYAMLAGAIST